MGLSAPCVGAASLYIWEESLAMGGTRDPRTLPLAPPSRGELPSTLADGAGATEGLLLTFKKSTKRGKILF